MKLRNKKRFQKKPTLNKLPGVINIRINLNKEIKPVGLPLIIWGACCAFYKLDLFSRETIDPVTSIPEPDKMPPPRAKKEVKRK